MSARFSSYCVLTVLMLSVAAFGSPAGLKLAEGETRNGVYRHPVVVLHPNIHAGSPSVAALPDGRVVVAFVVEENWREQVWLRWAEGPDAPFGKVQVANSGERASHPRLAQAADGSVWLVWCGLSKKPRPGVHERKVFLRKISRARLGPIIEVSNSDLWSCHPRMAIGPDGEVHLVWEQGSRSRVGIAYRAFSKQGQALGPVEMVARDTLARRPAVCMAEDELHVAWDQLVADVPTGGPDPDYDVFLRSRIKGRWQKTLAVDTRNGIQAAPSVVFDPRGGVLVAYHSTHRHPLVKWWTIRRIRNRRVEAVIDQDTAAIAKPSGEQQGAEFPVLLSVRGRILVLSRPSQGAYIQAVDESGISLPLSLAREGWGARGMQAEMVKAPDDSIIAVRRARSRVVLERLVLSAPWYRPPTFIQVSDPPKTKPLPLGRTLRLQEKLKNIKEISEYRLFFGDPHMHSAMSDGTGPADEVLARAWARGLDFAALTDHGSIVGNSLMPSEYDEIAWVSDLFNSRQNFSSLHAYEWTTAALPRGSGHRNVYFRKHVRDRICLSIYACPDTGKLSAWLKTQRAMAIPHHTGWTGTDWERAEAGLQRQFEIVSVHGAFEYLYNQPIKPRGGMAGMFAQDGLRKGYRFGFIGGSDAHGLLWHHGVGRKENPWATGLTGILAASNRRENLFDALFARRSFATSGARMVAWLSVGGVGMGSEAVLDRSLDVSYSAIGTRKLTSLEVVRDGKVATRIELSDEVAAGTWRDETWLEPGWHSYYLRVVQGTGQQLDMAWSSPVFIRVKKRAYKR